MAALALPNSARAILPYPEDPPQEFAPALRDGPDELIYPRRTGRLFPFSAEIRLGKNTAFPTSRWRPYLGDYTHSCSQWQKEQIREIRSAVDQLPLNVIDILSRYITSFPDSPFELDCHLPWPGHDSTPTFTLEPSNWSADSRYEIAHGRAVALKLSTFTFDRVIPNAIGAFGIREARAFVAPADWVAKYFLHIAQGIHRIATLQNIGRAAWPNVDPTQICPCQETYGAFKSAYGPIIAGLEEGPLLDFARLWSVGASRLVQGVKSADDAGSVAALNDIVVDNYALPKWNGRAQYAYFELMLFPFHKFVLTSPTTRNEFNRFQACRFVRMGEWAIDAVRERAVATKLSADALGSINRTRAELEADINDCRSYVW